MPPTCAVCRVPFQRGGERFVIAETQAVHRSCASRIGVSVLVRTQMALEVARGEVADLRGQLGASEAARDRAEQQQRREFDRADFLRANVDRLNRHEVDARSARAALLASQERIRDLEDELRTRRQEAERERSNAASARTELALHQTLAGSRIASPEPIAATGTGTPDPERRDDTEVRFSLLELDLLK